MTDNIRLAQADDLPYIVDIYNSSIPGRLATADTEPVSIESRQAWFEAHQSANRPLWVLERDGQIAAWCCLSNFYGRPAYGATAEYSLYVAPAHHRKGLGDMLMKHMITACGPLGVTTLLGFIFGHNEPSLRMAEKFGFERWGTLPRVAVLDGIERDLVITGLRLIATN